MLANRKQTKILCILDGFGLAPKSKNNCIAQAHMPNFRRLLKDYFWTTLDADGEAVGQEAGLVGNSEVGHMNIGGLKLVPQLSYQITQSSLQGFRLNKDLAPDQVQEPKQLLEQAWSNKQELNRTIHLIGLFSTGAIHSDMRHWLGAIECSLQAGARKIVLHLITDGRDSDKQSLLATWQKFENLLEYRLTQNLPQQLSSWRQNLYLGSLGGRFYSMDRDKNWERTWKGILAMLDSTLIFEHRQTLAIQTPLKNLWLKYQINITELQEYLASRQQELLADSISLQQVADYLNKITADSYAQGCFDETLRPRALTDGIGRRDILWLINFRTDRMKQLAQILVELNRELSLEWLILSMNDYGDGHALSVVDMQEIPSGYFPLFKSQPVRKTLAEVISELGTLTLEENLDQNQNLATQEQLASKQAIVDKQTITKLDQAIYTTNRPILILCGPSGSGKGTLVKHLLETYPLFELSVSCTTRKPRPGEQDGKDYYFLSLAEFKQKIANQEFVEYQEVYEGVFYGTLKSEIQRIHNLGKIPVFEIDYMGGLNLKKLYPQAIDIFLMPPNREVLEQRLRARGTESEAEIQIRLQKAYQELKHAQEFTYCLVNNEWQQTIEEMKQLLKNLIEQNENFWQNQDTLSHPLTTENLQFEQRTKLYRQLHLSETEKYNHVTFFLNGGQNKQWPGEDWLVIPSHKVTSHAERPEMRAKEVTDALLQALAEQKYDYIIVNYANPDMVGHTGDITAGIHSMEFLDQQLGRLLQVVEKDGHAMLIVADHGNIEFVGSYEQEGQIFTDTEHNPSPVPCIIVSPDFKIDYSETSANQKQNLGDKLLKKLEWLKQKQICDPDLDWVAQILTQRNQIDLSDSENWLTAEQLRQISGREVNLNGVDLEKSKLSKLQLPLWYAGVLFLGL